jgi:PAS domain S-box-containing protein
MKLRTQLWFALSAVVLLVVAQGLADGWLASAQPPAKTWMWAGLTVTVLVILAAAGWLGRRFCAPVERLAQSARNAAAGRRQERPPPPATAEFRDLAATLNQLLDELQVAAQTRGQLEESLRTRLQELERETAARRAVEAELRERERRYRILMANLPGMAYRRRPDPDRTLEFASDGCRDLLGVPPEDLTSGRIRLDDLIHPEDQARVRTEIQAALAARRPYSLEYRIRHAAGSWRCVAEQGRAVLDDQGRITVAKGFLTDLTAQREAEARLRRLEDELRRAQKLEAIGALTGGVAHNFNNVLAAILGSAELLKMDLAPEHPAREFLDQIFVAGRRAREVVQQVVTFSQQREGEPSLIHLQPVVKECVKLLHATLPGMVKITSQLDPDCPPVLADPTLVHQLIMKLCLHAGPARLEKHGVLRVHLERCEFPVVGADGTATLGPGARLTIAHQGPDQPPTAAEDDGPDLAAIREIVHVHHGDFVVHRGPAGGVVFQVRLPAHPELLEPETAPVELPTVFSRNHERILLVDDDELAGRTAEQIIARLGYQVRWFQDPEAALAHFQARPEHYHLVISDLAMPGLTGNQLTAALRHLRPDVPVLITTGLLDHALVREARAAGAGNLLFKPVDPAVLAREIARALTAPGGV